MIDEVPFVVPASWCGHVVGVLMDESDARSLPGRLSIGSHGYPQVCPTGLGRVVPLHRYLLGLAPKDGLIGDHINRIKLDNRRSNLRVVTPSLNSSNRTSYGKSGRRGVYRQRSGRWAAQGNWPNYGATVYLGTFDTLEEAAQVAELWREAHLPGYVRERA